MLIANKWRVRLHNKYLADVRSCPTDRFTDGQGCSAPSRLYSAFDGLSVTNDIVKSYPDIPRQNLYGICNVGHEVVDRGAEQSLNVTCAPIYQGTCSNVLLSGGG